MSGRWARGENSDIIVMSIGGAVEDKERDHTASSSPAHRTPQETHMTAGDQPIRHNDDDGISTDSFAALESTFLRSVCKKKPLEDNLHGSGGH
ncbi:hypothetical protein G5714_015834 [Onychostoma macrolepis]|uniref:Uncharacterized protein n=1 Tax=Onychostoma macrolepis TaxID=369639 RepID=A0A7J6C7C9_9TELE|nr:hypothetical protein G5714_015834 [Onychostoma macrolepis]